MAAVLLVAAAGLLLPGARAGHPAAAPSASGAPTLVPPASGTPPRGRSNSPISDSPTSDGPASDGPTPEVPGTGPPTPPGSRLFRFAGPPGLELILPAGWSTLKSPDAKSWFVSSQQLGLPADGCAHPLDDFCTPLAHTLTSGGVLVMLQPQHSQAMADKFRFTGTKLGDEQLVPACRNVGGTSQWGALVADPAGSDALVEVTVCLSRPTAHVQTQVRDMVRTADFR
ncbi:hypothetical protein GA0115240_119024 [Streptomyces sp. DvalAA-14]|uniref:hypothetical protein n=1 Tax=unclassified Streptomyces TaxID=2593676 RepID=UPI00081BAC4B|nr:MULTISPECIES: hypothetical protein [unclassified Streptomyces]MYS20360.1 hypothetical protein [Streptomyces sp. SID4948]SCD67156.1 hypothetical protein GA0115240_119024 [Streptomyces sp. DvalAA-14]